ncbi:hypothetical protein ACGFW5_34545 [Streptomyces sp. NPDC048416]|uniref:hypothetical protein n=1 Tax=Streptomyces sp. NPDC048416 TaxID=3365546 RepID=UPI003723F344
MAYGGLEALTRDRLGRENTPLYGSPGPAPERAARDARLGIRLIEDAAQHALPVAPLKAARAGEMLRAAGMRPARGGPAGV